LTFLNFSHLLAKHLYSPLFKSHLPKMKAKTSEAKKAVENEKKGTLRGHLAEVSPFPTDIVSKEKVRAAKSEVAYWKERVRPRILKDGTATPELYLRLKEGGRDAWFCLNTANRGIAAGAARDIWQKVQVHGLDAVLAALKPTVRPARVCTLADYLDAAKALATVRATTLAEYEASLRRVIAGVRGIAPKSDRHADRAEWRAKVDAVRLDKVTPSEVRAWHKAELDIARAKGGEVAKDRRASTLASHLRDARALFAESIIAEVGKTLALPSPLPFEGITAAATTRRFVATLDPRELYAAATDLDADTRLAFDLLLCAGLRRGEADSLPWAHVDLKAGTVRIDVTPTFRPKSRESYRTVPLPADVVARLKAARKAKPTAELVLAPRLTKTARKAAGAKNAAYEYRAKAWPTLTAWLKSKGLRDLTPLHSLRKMSGSFIYAVAGLEAARQHLGHRDVSTTARSYLAARTVTVDLSAPSK
jgi:integrase